MESEVEEGFHRHPKREKPTNYVEFPSILPPELITEIISRLPVKSLLKFRLRECSFSSLFYNPVIELSELNYPIEVEYDEGLSPVGSINGLICLAHGYHSPKHLFLWNPSIRKYKKLPNSRPKFRYDACMYGFGYDGSGRSVFVKGKLHWTTHSRDQYVWGGGIVSFSLADENWGKVEEPCYGGKESISELGVFGNDLCGFSHDLVIGVDVWVMKDYGITESWTKICTITRWKLLWRSNPSTADSCLHLDDEA
ncbi:hypothetical protein MTR67_044817 [Solanum verrucosum]|uniref:F-box associated beta-propeller type 1 domain-containing protein n=1 Tax=Solanum verrucosum TaxID=315347 RepID=A0AAF0US75_SOLVR|nr:hypothetical protein MTR67_044817 [Solanum verrucosum]